MDNQEKFIEMIQDVVSMAKINNREVTKEFLREFLQELKLSEEQMEFVYQYLLQENIKVTGYQAARNTKTTQKEGGMTEGLDLSKKDVFEPEKVEESEYLELYLKEIESVGSCNQVEKKWYEQAGQGDDKAKSFIVEQKLARVAQIADRFAGQGMTKNDLIGEGNVALLLAVEQLSNHQGEEEQFIDQEIEKSMLLALDQHREERRENRGLMKKAENLKEKMERLEEDLGGKMTSDDVAAFTGMDLEEIQGILRMTGDSAETQE